MSELRSEEGITELRDLVAQTLEKNGALAKIKAELRASVFLALEEQEAIENKAPYLNQPLKDFLSTSEGELISCLVREFLEYFHLDFTLSVFDQETYHDKEYHYMGREKLCRNLKIKRSDVNGPVLADVLQLASREDFRKISGTNGEDDSVSIEEMQNSYSDNSAGSKSHRRRQNKELTKTVETIKVTLQPKTKQSEDQDIVDFCREVKNIEDYAEMKSSSNLNDGIKVDSPKSKSEIRAVSSPVLDQGELKTTESDSLVLYEEDFHHSNASGNDINENNAQTKGTTSPPPASVTEDIEEDIHSAGDDALSSNTSAVEDTTADDTISNPAGEADYMEQV